MRSLRPIEPWLLRAVGFLAAGQAALAQACPVCFSAKDEANRQAFFDTTIFLTLLPLAMIGGIAYWVAKRSARLDAELAAEQTREAVKPVEPPSTPAAPAATATPSR